MIMIPVFWFTGLSGAGKTTLAAELAKYIKSNYDIPSMLLDGDELRSGLCSDLTFSKKDRTENIRRIAYCAKLLSDYGISSCVSCITPFNELRQMARQIIGDNFFEIYIACDIEICRQRDVKGLYRQCEDGKINNFTGISSPFEIPDRADLVINTSDQSIISSVTELIDGVSFFINQK